MYAHTPSHDCMHCWSFVSYCSNPRDGNAAVLFQAHCTIQSSCHLLLTAKGARIPWALGGASILRMWQKWRTYCKLPVATRPLWWLSFYLLYNDQLWSYVDVLYTFQVHFGDMLHSYSYTIVLLWRPLNNNNGSLCIPLSKGTLHLKFVTHALAWFHDDCYACTGTVPWQLLHMHWHSSMTVATHALAQSHDSCYTCTGTVPWQLLHMHWHSSMTVATHALAQSHDSCYTCTGTVPWQLLHMHWHSSMAIVTVTHALAQFHGNCNSYTCTGMLLWWLLHMHALARSHDDCNSYTCTGTVPWQL